MGVWLALSVLLSWINLSTADHTCTIMASYSLYTYPLAYNPMKAALVCIYECVVWPRVACRPQRVAWRGHHGVRAVLCGALCSLSRHRVLHTNTA
jgi:hypothetical protein